MKTEELISRLVADATPVRPLAPTRVRLGRWMLAALAVAAAGVLLVGPRADLPEAIRQPAFLAIVALLAATAVLSAAAALTLSIPGAERSPLDRALPFVAAATWPLVWIVALARQEPAGAMPAFEFHGACGPLIAGLAGLPAWVLLRMLRAGATLRPAWGATLAALAAIASAAAAMQIICPIDAPSHQMLEHVLPATILCAVGVTVGPRWLASAPRTPRRTGGVW